MNNGFYITKLEFVGENKSSSINLIKGLNVIYGPTSTGKSFMFDSINFMLGGKDRPEEIDEIKDYELIRMEIHPYKGKPYTLERNKNGGSFKKFDLEINDINHNSKYEVLGSTNNAKKSVSNFLLSLSGFKNVDYKVRKNQSNELNRFSFRSMNHLVMVDEVRIITKRSPVFSGVPQSKTTEQSILKLLLTNMDDSNLEKEIKETDHTYRNVKLDLIQNIIDETKVELQDIAHKKAEFEKLLGDINKLSSLKDLVLKDIEELALNRNSIWNKLQSYNAKELSINALIKRFFLLESQYNSDLERLIFLSEGSHYFNQLSMERCPVCHKELDNEMNVHEEHLNRTENKIEGVKVEINKINRHKKDLEKTVLNIKIELKEVQEKKQLAINDYEKINELIEQELKPNLNNINKELDDILRKHTEYNHILFLEENLKKLELRKTKIETVETKTDTTDTEGQEISNDVIDDLCSEIEGILIDWDFPESEVTYDLNTYDILIGGKKRSMYGKGYRAIAFSAFILGLMKFCIRKSLPHAGFIILDSPLTTYKEEDNPEDEVPEEIQNKFYNNLSNLDYQVIVFENKKPQQEVINNINFVEFTKNNKVGRFGFIEK